MEKADEMFEANECEWCGNIRKGCLNIDGKKVCLICAEQYELGKCRRCGKEYPKERMVLGLCLECQQRREVVEREIKADIEVGNIPYREDEQTKLTDEQFEKIMTAKSSNNDAEGVNTKDFMTNKLYRRLWIMFKLRITGASDSVINRHLGDAEKLVSRNIDNIIGHKTKLAIIEDEQKANEKVAGLRKIDSEDVVNLFSDEE